jgi:hypothetical protein
MDGKRSDLEESIYSVIARSFYDVAIQYLEMVCFAEASQRRIGKKWTNFGLVYLMDGKRSDLKISRKVRP